MPRAARHSVTAVVEYTVARAGLAAVRALDRDVVGQAHHPRGAAGRVTAWETSTDTMVSALRLGSGPGQCGVQAEGSWPWGFWLNFRFGLGGSLWAALVRRELGGQGEDHTFDFLGTATFLLPVHAENLSCQRGSPICMKNAIDFRDYHKYSGESTITFDK